MMFYYCVICQHYHIDDSKLPCNDYKNMSWREVAFMLERSEMDKIKAQSQSMLNQGVFLQTLEGKK